MSSRGEIGRRDEPGLRRARRTDRVTVTSALCCDIGLEMGRCEAE